MNQDLNILLDCAVQIEASIKQSQNGDQKLALEASSQLSAIGQEISNLVLAGTTEDEFKSYFDEKILIVLKSIQTIRGLFPDCTFDDTLTQYLDSLYTLTDDLGGLEIIVRFPESSGSNFH